jgi:hypothetical protein
MIAKIERKGRTRASHVFIHERSKLWIGLG